MWLLVIIALSSEPPYKSRGTISIPFTSQSECRKALTENVPLFKFDKTNITASCSFRGYLTP